MKVGAGGVGWVGMLVALGQGWVDRKILYMLGQDRSKWTVRVIISLQVEWVSGENLLVR